MQGIFLKIFVLLVLIVVLVFFGVFVVGRIGLFQLSGVFEKVGESLGLGSSGYVKEGIDNDQRVDYDRFQSEKERLEQWESSLRQMGMNIEEEKKILQQRMVELDARENELFQKEENIKKTSKMYENIGEGLRVTADSLMSMPPEKSVEILLNMEDPAIIDVFNMVNSLSKERNVVSLVPIWMQIMPPNRVADVVRKMTLD